MTENMEGVEALVVNDEVIAIELPDTVELPIVETAPGVRGNSATGRTKPATLSTGHVIQVPEHLDPGVDRPGRHPHRANTSAGAAEPTGGLTPSETTGPGCAPGWPGRA